MDPNKLGALAREFYIHGTDRVPYEDMTDAEREEWDELGDYIGSYAVHLVETGAIKEFWEQWP